MKQTVTRKSGFTLVETAVVLAIVAIISAIAIPNYSSWRGKYRLKAATRDLYSRMHNTKTTAVKEGKTWAIVFDEINSTYSICSDDGADDDWTTMLDNTCPTVIDLASYGFNIGFTFGPATTEPLTGCPKAPGPALAGTNYVTYTNNVATFSSDDTADSGWAFISNDQNKQTSAVGSTNSGMIRIQSWDGGAWR